MQESYKLSKRMKKSRRKYEKQLALKVKTQPKWFFAHERRKRHLKKKYHWFMRDLTHVKGVNRKYAKIIV